MNTVKILIKSQKKYFKKIQIELKNTISKIKIYQKELDDTEEQISELEDKVIEIKVEQKKEKSIFKK